MHGYMTKFNQLLRTVHALQHADDLCEGIVLRYDDQTAGLQTVQAGVRRVLRASADGGHDLGHDRIQCSLVGGSDAAEDTPFGRLRRLEQQPHAIQGLPPDLDGTEVFERLDEICGMVIQVSRATSRAKTRSWPPLGSLVRPNSVVGASEVSVFDRRSPDEPQSMSADLRHGHAAVEVDAGVDGIARDCPPGHSALPKASTGRLKRRE
jgi:hypothetical protein